MMGNKHHEKLKDCFSFLYGDMPIKEENSTYDDLMRKFQSLLA